MCGDRSNRAIPRTRVTSGVRNANLGALAVVAAGGLFWLLQLPPAFVRASTDANPPGTAPQATASVAATSTPSPSPTPIVVNGVLRSWQAADGCQGDAVVVDCLNPTVAYVLRAPLGTNLARYFGQKTQIEGILRDCGAAGGYVAVQKVTPLDRCDSGQGPVTPLNLALGASTVQDEKQSPLPGFGPELVTDGDARTYWYYPASSASDRTWLRLDLGTEVYFNVLRLRWGESYATQFIVYVWDARLGASGKWVPVHQQLRGKGGEESITLARVAGRFVLIYLTHSETGTGGYQLREWQIYNQSSPNLVLGQGKNLRVSSAQGGYGGELAVDGDMRFGWASAGGDPKPFITARLPATHAVTDYRLIWRWPAIPALYRAVFYRGADPYVQTSPQASLDPIHTLSWRVPFDADAFGVFAESIGNQAGYIEILEMELYGPDSAALRPLTIGPKGLGPDQLFGAGRTIDPRGALEPVAPGAYPRLSGDEWTTTVNPMGNPFNENIESSFCTPLCGEWPARRGKSRR